MKFILNYVRNEQDGRGVFIISPETPETPGSCIHKIERAVREKGIKHLSRFDRQCLLEQVKTIRRLQEKEVDIIREG